MKKTDPNFWWNVSFSIIPEGKQAGEEYDKDFWVLTKTTCDALLGATELLKKEMEAGELIHTVHVGAPRRKPPLCRSI